MYSWASALLRVKRLNSSAGLPKLMSSPTLDAGCVQVVDGLGFMFRDESFHRLEFDHNLFFNYEIGIKVANRLPPKEDLDGLLRLNGKSSVRERNHHGLLIYGLQKPAPKLIDDLKRAPDNRPSQLRVQ